MNYPQTNRLLLNLTLGREDICREIVVSTQKDGNPVNWETLIDIAVYHGVASIIYRNIRDAKYEFLDKNFYSEIESYYYGIAGKNTKYFREMEKILLSLNESGVGTIVLKGAALGESVYNNIALRPIEDIDLLVKKFDFPAAKAAFRRWGYNVHDKPFPSSMHKKIEQERHKPFEKYESELHFFDRQNRYFFDVHWNLLIICESGISETVQLNIERIWKRAKTIRVGEAKAYLMSDEDLLIYLCLHLRERHFEKARSRLIWWHDIYMILKKRTADFNVSYFLSAVSEYGAGISVFSVLKTAETLFGIKLPDEIDNAIDSDIVCFDLDKVIPEPTDQIKYRKVFKEKDYVSDLKNISGFSRKFRIIAGDIFPDSRYMVSYYRIENKGLLPFYYLLRIKNIIIKGIKAAGKL